MIYQLIFLIYIIMHLFICLGICCFRVVGLEKEIARLRKKEAEETLVMEQAVQQVEQNLVATTVSKLIVFFCFFLLAIFTKTSDFPSLNCIMQYVER